MTRPRCKIEGCRNLVQATKLRWGMCQGHYRQKIVADPLHTAGREYLPFVPLERWLDNNRGDSSRGSGIAAVLGRTDGAAVGRAGAKLPGREDAERIMHYWHRARRNGWLTVGWADWFLCSVVTGVHGQHVWGDVWWEPPRDKDVAAALAGGVADAA